MDTDDRGREEEEEEKGGSKVQNRTRAQKRKWKKLKRFLIRSHKQIKNKTQEGHKKNKSLQKGNRDRRVCFVKLFEWSRRTFEKKEQTYTHKHEKPCLKNLSFSKTMASWIASALFSLPSPALYFQDLCYSEQAAVNVMPPKKRWNTRPRTIQLCWQKRGKKIFLNLYRLFEFVSIWRWTIQLDCKKVITNWT